MKAHHISIPNHGDGSMLNQKTYEDFNKEKPEPYDINFMEPNPIVALTLLIGSGEKKEIPTFREASDGFNYLRD